MATWRKWVVEGRYADARQALSAHLEKSPGDGAGWALLADCHRKTKNWDGAINAYRKTIQRSGPSEANRARILAASILLEHLQQYESAAKMLEQYLATSGGGAALRPEAMVRLARAYIGLNRKQRAKALLVEVTRDYGNHSVATKARRLLESLEGS